MTHRHSGCPLCGGKLSALDLLNACDELADAELGILSARGAGMAVVEVVVLGIAVERRRRLVTHPGVLRSMWMR